MMTQMLRVAGSGIPLIVIGGLLYAGLFIKPQPSGHSIPPPAIDRRDYFYDIAEPAPGVIWAVGSWGKVVRSDDGGRSFRVQPVPTTNHLQGIVAWDALRAAAVGNDGIVLATADGGRSWTRGTAPRSEVSNKLMRVRAAGDGVAWAVGEMGALYRTVDAGRTWARQRPQEDVGWYDVAFRGRLGWVVGEFGRVLVSRDGGETWQDAESPVESSLMAVAFRDDANGVAVGLDGVLLASDDGGAIWRELPRVTSEHVFDVAWDGDGWLAVGDKGLILRGDGPRWRAGLLAPNNYAWHTAVRPSGRGAHVAGAALGVVDANGYRALGRGARG